LLYLYIYISCFAVRILYVYIICEVIKRRKTYFFLLLEGYMLALVVDDKICFAAVHIFTYTTDLSKAVVLCLTRRKIIHRYAKAKYVSVNIVRDMFILRVPIKHYFEKLLSVCIFFLYVYIIYYIYMRRLAHYILQNTRCFIFHFSFCFLGLNFWVTCVGNRWHLCKL